MFTKLFSSIIYSSVWREDNATRLVWITLLALANRRGCVYGSVGGLAGAARVSDQECAEALKKFEGPDADSGDPENEGRRVERIRGGWRLLNYEKYRGMRDEEARREYKAEWARTKRAEKAVVSGVGPTAAERAAEKYEKEDKPAEAERTLELDADMRAAPEPELGKKGRPTMKAMARSLAEEDPTTKRDRDHVDLLRAREGKEALDRPGVAEVPEEIREKVGRHHSEAAAEEAALAADVPEVEAESDGPPGNGEGEDEDLYRQSPD